MSKINKTQKNKLPSWNLSDLFSNIKDPKINQVLNETLKSAEKFEKKYRPQINNSLTSTQLLKLLREYENIMYGAIKVYLYAELIFEADTKQAAHGALLQKAKTQYVAVSQKFIFIELELLKLRETKLNSFVKDPKLANYKHYLSRILEFKPHRLSEQEEKIFSDKGLTGRGALTRLFAEELSQKQFQIKLKGKVKTLNESQVLVMLYDTDRDVRRAAAQSLTDGLKEESRRLTFITNTLLQDKQINDKYFKYNTPEESRHLDNEISQAAVDTMVGQIAKNYKTVQDFYRFKKKVIKLPTLYDYDRYAPVSKHTKSFSYKEAQEIVLTSFTKFSPLYGKLGKDFFDNNWIDVPMREGKRGGAFCSYGLPNAHPYVLMNYSGNIREVLTLAHELGHGIHASLFKKQTLVNFDTPLTMAETASVFAEMLVFDDLKEKLKGPEKFALYMDKVESIFATVFRQNSMFLFERDLHKARAQLGELTTEQINEIWIKRQKEMFADSVTLTPNYSLWWSYIPHFVNTPFYVYAYAFGELLTLSLYAKYKAEGQVFVDKYLAFLAAGGSQSPEELLKPLGVDLEDPKFWQGGLKTISDLVEETKSLYKK
jgi:oligoendopeptidase F